MKTRIMEIRWNRLSNGSQEFIKQYNNYNTADRFYVATTNYMMRINDFFSNANLDEYSFEELNEILEDYRTLGLMLDWLDNNMNYINELEAK